MNKGLKLFWLLTKLGINLPGWKANMRSPKGILKTLLFGGVMLASIAFVMWVYVFLMTELIELATMATGMAGTGIGDTMANYLLTILMATAIFAGMILVLIFGIIRNMGVYYSKDTEFLASLPIKQRSVYAAKFFHSYAGEILVFAMIVLPPVIIMGMRTSVDFFFWVKALLVCLLGPMPAFAIASVVAAGLVRISVLARHRDKIMTFGGFILMLVWIIGWQFLGQAMNHMDTEAIMNFITVDMIETIGRVFPPTIWASHSIIYTGSTGLAALGKFLGVCALGAGFSIFVAGRMYQRGAVAQGETAKTGKRLDMAKATGKTRSQLMAIYVKEWKILFRVPIYALNGLVQIVITPIMPIIMFVVPMQGEGMEDFSFLMQEISNPEFLPWFILIAAAIIFFFCTMNTAGATAYSREGQSVWMLQCMPIKAATIARGKLLFALSISAITCLTSFISMSIVFKMVTGPALAMLFAFIASVPIITISNTTDMIRPKLKWESEQKAIKQNLNQFFAILIEMVFMAGVGFLTYFMLAKWGQELPTVLILVTAISIVLAVVSYIWMVKAAPRAIAKMGDD